MIEHNADGRAGGGSCIFAHLWKAPGEPTIYHMGDTDIFGDMALIPKHRPVDVMLACIGSP